MMKFLPWEENFDGTVRGGFSKEENKVSSLA